jgi:hypothetical protein
VTGALRSEDVGVRAGDAFFKLTISVDRRYLSYLLREKKKGFDTDLVQCQLIQMTQKSQQIQNKILCLALYRKYELIENTTELQSTNE